MPRRGEGSMIPDPRRRPPDELVHRMAHAAAGKAADKMIQKISVAYDSVFWDDTAKSILAAIAPVQEKGKFMHPADAAEIASEYADALLAQRQKRVEGK